VNRFISFERIKDRHPGKSVRLGNLVSAGTKAKRKGWEQAFREMAKNDDDELTIPDVFEDEQTRDWKWK